jgi:hypothetical protein
MFLSVFKDVDVNESIIADGAAKLSVQKPVSYGDETVLFLFMLSSKRKPLVLKMKEC